MPLLRKYDAERNIITVSAYDAYMDRLYRPSDIQDYLEFLYQEAAARTDPVILELGTRSGNSTLAFLAGAKRTGMVWSVDIEDSRLNPNGMMAWSRLPYWTFIHGDCNDSVVQEKLPQEVDILFDDASHDYLPTLEECRAYVPRVKPGGVALFHDTKLLTWNENGVPWWGEDKSDQYPPVRQALDDYCAETGLTWYEMEGEYGLGVIRC